MMGGGGGGGGGVVPFNMSALESFMPSVFKGPYNAQGAKQNEQMIANKYPWITPPAGQFEGAQPGQFAAGPTGNSGAFPGLFGMLESNIPGGQTAQNPNPPIPPQVTPAPAMGGQFNPMAMSAGQTNAMQPNSLQSILAVLGGGQQLGTGGY